MSLNEDPNFEEVPHAYPGIDDMPVFRSNGKWWRRKDPKNPIVPILAIMSFRMSLPMISLEIRRTVYLMKPTLSQILLAFSILAMADVVTYAFAQESLFSFWMEIVIILLTIFCQSMRICKS
jgi:hypothetical protein